MICNKHCFLSLILLFPAFIFGQQTPGCDTSKNAHVFNSKRFKIKAACITVTGVVQKLVPAADGDVHIALKLDSGQANLVNSSNLFYWGGCLVAEIICEHEPDSASGVGYICKGYKNNIKIPAVGKHISVTGRFVEDDGRNAFGFYGWNEIHPVSCIVELK